MGLGGFIKKIGKAIEKPFRTGASAAERDAKQAAEQQADQYNQFYEMMKPAIEFGTQSLKGLGQYSTADGLNNLYQSISGSGLANSMIQDQQDAAGQALASAGLRRSGVAAREAAQIPTDVIAQLMQTIMGNQQNMASLGLGQGGAALGALGGIGNANASYNQAAQAGVQHRGGVMGGLLQGAGSIIGGLFSDRRLKTNERVIGKIGPLSLYEWDWVEGAEAQLGAVMKTGFMADEVAEHYPQHVHPVEVSGVELLTVNYSALLRSLEAAHDA